MDKLQFRRFTTEDIPECAQMIADTWPISNVIPKEGVIDLVQTFLDFFRLYSTWLEVVCTSGKVIGFLFGKINRDYGMGDRFKAFFAILATVIRAFAGRYGTIPKRFTLLRKLVLTIIKTLLNSPKADGEVILFVVDCKYRGKGIGRMLMDRFLDVAKRKNAKIITLCTEQKTCNWKFYEIYGFKRYRTFYDDLIAYVINEDTNSFIYVIDLPR